MIIYTNTREKLSNERRSVRLYSAPNIQTFQRLILNTVWDEIYHFGDVNDAYEVYECKLNACFNARFPLVKVSRGCAHDKRWITSGIKVCIKKEK